MALPATVASKRQTGQSHPAERRSTWRAWVLSKREALSLAGLLALIFAAFLFRLRSVVLSDMDEGTYLYGGKLLAHGLVPYRDFFVTHPPVIFLLTGGWIRLFGDAIMPARIAYMVLILAGTVPLYLIGRSLTRSRLGGMLTIVVYTTGMLLIANMGRTIRLEPVMNLFLIGAFACYLLRPNSMRARALMGALCAVAVLVKVVAFIPIAMLVAGDLIWIRPWGRSLRLWSAAAAGAAVIAVPAMAILLSEPGFFDGVVRLQMQRPGLGLSTKLLYVRQDFTRYPLIPLALAASLWFLIRAGDVRVRIVSFVTLTTTAALVLGFRTFFGYYLVQELPFVGMLIAVLTCAAARTVVPRRYPVAIGASVLLLGVAVPALYGQYYYQTATDHVSSPARIVTELQRGDGYIYSLYPSFALWSNRDLYPWRYAADSLVPRITNRISDEDFMSVFAGSRALVLYTNEMSDRPAVQSYIEQHFTIGYQDAYYTLWVRP